MISELGPRSQIKSTLVTLTEVKPSRDENATPKELNKCPFLYFSTLPFKTSEKMSGPRDNP